jgi:hypothetical protein
MWRQNDLHAQGHSHPTRWLLFLLASWPAAGAVASSLNMLVHVSAPSSASRLGR